MLRLMLMRALLGTAAALMLVAGCGFASTEAQESTSATAMRPDVAGLATLEPGQGYRLVEDGDPSRFGPARLRIGDRVLDVPANTPVHRGCALMRVEWPTDVPCLLQVGLDQRGQVAWARGIQSATRMLPQPGSEIVFAGAFSYGGKIATVTAAEMTFTDGATFPVRPGVLAEECGESFAPVPLVTMAGRNRLVSAEVTPDTVEVVRVVCPGMA